MFRILLIPAAAAVDATLFPLLGTTTRKPVSA